jgi:hypothetical protein
MTEAAIDVNKEVGREENMWRTKYTLKSPQQNAGQNRKTMIVLCVSPLLCYDREKEHALFGNGQ